MVSVSSSGGTGPTRRRIVAGLGLVLLLVACWGVLGVIDLVRRDQAAARLLAAIEGAPAGGVVDVATAYDLPWDRAVVVGPYWNGDAANAALGFDHFPPDAAPTTGENASLLLIVRSQTVLSEIRPWEAEAFFEEGVEQFTPEDGRFGVHRENGWATLVPE